MKRIGRGLLPLLALAVWSACSDEKPAATTAPAATAAVIQADGNNNHGSGKSSVGDDDDANDVRAVAILTRGNESAQFVREMIGREGGRVRLDGFEIIVPRGAVNHPTAFSITFRGGKKRLAMAEFAPHNQQFNVPVTIIVPWKDTNLASNELARVIWWDRKAWVPIPTTFTRDGRLSAQTIHFSMYACGLTVAGG